MSAALFSPDRMYRNALLRRFPLTRSMDRGVCNIIMLNPSTADETVDDPTIRRCIGFAQGLGYTRLVVTNLFAYRATDPKMLASILDPVGDQNHECIRLHASLADRVIVAWGVHGSLMGRGDEILSQLALMGIRPDCFGMTKDGHPKHPLYLATDTAPIPFVRVEVGVTS